MKQSIINVHVCGMEVSVLNYCAIKCIYVADYTLINGLWFLWVIMSSWMKAERLCVPCRQSRNTDICWDISSSGMCECTLVATDIDRFGGRDRSLNYQDMIFRFISLKICNIKHLKQSYETVIETVFRYFLWPNVVVNSQVCGQMNHYALDGF